MHIFFGIFLVSVLFIPLLMPVEAQDLPYFGAIVELNKVVYAWTDGVWITVTAPNFNSDPTKIDYIGDKSDSRITITFTNGKKLDFYKLEETGVDTGVFIGHVLLTGFSHDVNGDGTDDPIVNIHSITKVIENITGDTSGKGPWDGRMKAEPGNGITVKFSEAYSGSTNTHDASATVEFWIAELGLRGSTSDHYTPAIKSNEPVTVTIVDPDMNLDYFSQDQLYVGVYSDSDAGGFQLLLTETEILDDDGTSFLIQNSGIFEGQFSYVSVGTTNKFLAEIFAEPGDTITVEYTDCTLPQPFNIGECVTLAGKAKAVTGEYVTPPEAHPKVVFKLDSLSTNKNNYAIGEIIELRGSVSTSSTTTPSVKIFFTVIDPAGEHVFSTLQQVFPKKTGEFFTVINIPAEHRVKGEYIIVVYSVDLQYIGKTEFTRGTPAPVTTPEPTPAPVTAPVAGEPKVTDSMFSPFAFAFANARVVDEFGASIPEVTVGQQIQIVADIMNGLDKEQSFVYVLLVQQSHDVEGVKLHGDDVAVEWTEGSLGYLEQVSQALPWTPSTPGSYFVTLAIYPSMDNPSPLAEYQSISIDVFAKTPEPVTAIPGWIKNNAEWWASDQIDDSSFLQGIQFLIKEGIIVIPPTVTTGASESQEVPSWIKNNAEWWAQGQIDDNTFVSGIQYLVKVGIIKVS